MNIAIEGFLSFFLPWPFNSQLGSYTQSKAVERRGGGEMPITSDLNKHGKSCSYLSFSFLSERDRKPFITNLQHASDIRTTTSKASIQNGIADVVYLYWVVIETQK